MERLQVFIVHRTGTRNLSIYTLGLKTESQRTYVILGKDNDTPPPEGGSWSLWKC